MIFPVHCSKIKLMKIPVKAKGVGKKVKSPEEFTKDSPESSLLEQLKGYGGSDFYPFHMPGHKRAALDFPNPWSVDITEIEGFDNLHHASGILQSLQREAARLFGAKKSFLLINGSTCGLLSAISACVRRGGKLLMSRNCHKSVYHGVYLRDITPVYAMPPVTEFGVMGSLPPKAVERALMEEPDIQAVLVVSPTYDGVVSNIGQIAEICHRQGVPLIVDEAHGAHFPFSEHFSESAVKLGADVVVQSLHKTLPSFTQTALLHLCSQRVEEGALKRFLSIFQSSSPSYLLMASMEQCMTLLRQEGPKRFLDFHWLLRDFYQKCQGLSQIRLFSGQGESHCFDHDYSKILISAASLGLSGQELYRILLDKYHLQMEMASGHYVLALTSLMDRAEGFHRLAEALFQIEDENAFGYPGGITKAVKNADIISSGELYQIPYQTMTITRALELPGKNVPLEASEGATSREFLYLYPPGIPLLAPGERIEGRLLHTILRIREAGLPLEGLSDMTNTRINIVNS